MRTILLSLLMAGAAAPSPVDTMNARIQICEAASDAARQPQYRGINAGEAMNAYMVSQGYSEADRIDTLRLCYAFLRGRAYQSSIDRLI